MPRGRLGDSRYSRTSVVYKVLSIDDIVVRGAVAGIATSAVQIICELVLQGVGFVKYTTLDYIATLITVRQMSQQVCIAVSVVTFLISSSVFGSIISYSRYIIGPRFWYAKGLGIGGVLFVLHDAIIPKIWEPALVRVIHNENYLIMDLVTHIGWGLATSGLCLALSPDRDNHIDWTAVAQYTQTMRADYLHKNSSNRRNSSIRLQIRKRRNQ